METMKIIRLHLSKTKLILCYVGWMIDLCKVAVVAKALVRLLRPHYEVQAIVLNSIAAMTIQETAQQNQLKFNL